MEAIHILTGRYLEVCREQKKLSPLTVKGYEIDLRQFEEFSLSKLDRLGKDSLDSYCRHLNQKYKPRTAKRKIASLRAFCRWLEFEEILPADPFRKVITKVREIKSLPRNLSLYAVSKMFCHLYALVDAEDPEKPSYRYLVRDAAILEPLFATGMRVSELCSLKIENLHFSTPAVTIMGKGSKERVIPIENPEVIGILQHALLLFQDSIRQQEYVFYNRLGRRISQQSVRNLVSRYAREAGVAGHITPHIIRHTFATLMLEEDVDIRYIQKMLGHSSIRTTEIYTSVSNPKERKIVAEKHPRNKIKILQVNTTLSGKSQGEF